MVAFDRFLSRLFSHGADQWVVRCGFALQLRPGTSARTTKDIDLLGMGEVHEIYPHLREFGAIELVELTVSSKSVIRNVHRGTPGERSQ